MEFTDRFLAVFEDKDTTKSPEEIVSQKNQSLSIGIGGGLQELFSTETNKNPTTSTQQIDYTKEADRLMSSLVFTESNGIHREKDGTLRVSEKGAQGLTQIMPHTGAKPGFGVRPLQNQSVQEYYRVGRDYLAAMMKHFNSVEQGIAAYNAGPGRLQKVLAKASKEGKDWKEFLPKETKEYLKKVR